MAQDNESYRSNATAHIRALSALETRLPPILRSAATTVSQLTNSPIPSSPTATDSKEARREVLASSAKEYFDTVLNLQKILHQQIDDLEKAGVIPGDEVRYIGRTGSEADKKIADASALAQTGMAQTTSKDSEATVTNGGLGGFDVSVLNARAAVPEQGEGKDLERLKRLLEDFIPRTNGDAEGEKMDET